MIKIRFIYCTILCLLSGNLIGQDTTFIDKPSKYCTKNGDSYRLDDTGRLKGYPKVNYSRELIKLTENHYKIENCYYYDNIRFTNYYSTNYTLINDSLIKINEEMWFYEKINDNSFKVTKSEDNSIEKGTVSSLIPFTKNGDFVTYNLKGKKLFTEKFGTKKYTLETVKHELDDTVYYGGVDKIAIFPKKYGDLERYIHDQLKFPGIARESAIQGTVYIRFVVTSNGEVVNVEILRGVDPFYDKEALRSVSVLPDFEPGQLKGKNVNMYYQIPIRFQLK